MSRSCGAAQEEEEEGKEDADHRAAGGRDSAESASLEPVSLEVEKHDGEGSMMGAAPPSPPKLPPRNETVSSPGAPGSMPDSVGWCYAATPEARALAPLVQLCVLQPLYSVARAGADADVVKRRDLARRVGSMGLLVLGAFRLEEDSPLARSRRTLEVCRFPPFVLPALPRYTLSSLAAALLLPGCPAHGQQQPRLSVRPPLAP